jgi:hypothetical protein
MGHRLSSATFAGLLLAAALVAGATPRRATAQGADEAAPRPDFSGEWLFNAQRSDDLRKVIEGAVGPGYTLGDIKHDEVRVWIRRWLLGVLEDPDSRYLTIEQNARDFKTGLGDEVSIYYFGREASSRGPAGGTLKVSVTWKGSQLVTEEKAEDGGRIVCLYTMLPGDDTLILVYHLEHKSLKKPVEARMFFDRVKGDD